jgi:hypothetical protein
MFKAFTLGCSVASLVILAFSGGSAHAQSVSGVVVPGSSNPYLAGMPNGSTASFDTAPAQSPVQVLGLNIAGGGTLTFSATGTVTFDGFSANGPDGGFSVLRGDENGLSGYHAPVNALVGVFLDNVQPNQSAAPVGLDFFAGTPGTTSFTSLSPQLKQIFFIGDGRTGTESGASQTFVIPSGATRFYLGTVDGSGWFNNTGQHTVSISQIGPAASAPEPGTLALLAAASLPLGGAVAYRRLKA